MINRKYNSEDWFDWADWLRLIALSQKGRYRSCEEELVENALELFWEMGVERSVEWWLYCKGEQEEPGDVLANFEKIPSCVNRRDKRFQSYLRLDNHITMEYNLPLEDYKGKPDIAPREIPLTPDMILTPLREYDADKLTYGPRIKKSILTPSCQNVLSSKKDHDKKIKQANSLIRPDRACKDKGRFSMRNRLKSEEVRNVKFRSFENAREYVRSLGLRNQSEWTDYINSGIAKDIPRNPSGYYDGEGWGGWDDWLGIAKLTES